MRLLRVSMCLPCQANSFGRNVKTNHCLWNTEACSSVFGTVLFFCVNCCSTSSTSSGMFSVSVMLSARKGVIIEVG